MSRRCVLRSACCVRSACCACCRCSATSHLQALLSRVPGACDPNVLPVSGSSPNYATCATACRDMRRGEQRAVALALEPDHLHVDIRWQGQLPGQPCCCAL